MKQVIKIYHKNVRGLISYFLITEIKTATCQNFELFAFTFCHKINLHIYGPNSQLSAVFGAEQS